MSAKGIRLQDITWMQAQGVLSEATLVVIPLGAAAKEHGPHLTLDNDHTLAQYLADRVLEAADVVVAPTVAYHYYPAFVEYPGSITLRLTTARDLIVDICTSLSAFGPRRFYVLNTGVSTLRALSAAAQELSQLDILLAYSDLRKLSSETVHSVSQQPGGSHADEIETSMMLYIAPERVQMDKAVCDYHPGKGRLSRNPALPGTTYSASGVFGDATLATPDKGELVTEALVRALLADIARLRANAVR